MEYLTMGGVTATVAEAWEALAVLLESKGVMIKQTIERVGNPLASMDYHAIAADEPEQFPELVLRPGSHRKPTPHEKTAVIHYLRRILGA